MGEALRWPTGLARKPLEARGFYGVIATATLLGLTINFPFVQKFTHLTPIKALFWSAVINGLVAVPLMAVIMLMVRNADLMGKFRITSRWLRIPRGLPPAVMAAPAVGMIVTWKR